jgi:hypothetical protein
MYKLCCLHEIAAVGRLLLAVFTMFRGTSAVVLRGCGTVSLDSPGWRLHNRVTAGAQESQYVAQATRIPHVDAVVVVSDDLEGGGLARHQPHLAAEDEEDPRRRHGRQPRDGVERVVGGYHALLYRHELPHLHAN